MPIYETDADKTKEEIIAAYKDQIARFEERKAKAVKGLPRSERVITEYIETLEARITELEERLRQRDRAIERYASNALKLGVPRTSLDRPLSVRRGIS